MIIIFEINDPSKFSVTQIDQFLKLLIYQNQVKDPSLKKIRASKLICIVYDNENPIGIGAIKQVYKSPFDKAEVSELKNDFEFELGYLFVNNDDNFKDLGIGKTICKLLLKHLGDENIFATTDLNDKNAMKYILESLGFKKTGKSYIGEETKKLIGLYIKNSSR